MLMLMHIIYRVRPPPIHALYLERLRSPYFGRPAPAFRSRPQLRVPTARRLTRAAYCCHDSGLEEIHGLTCRSM